MATRRFRVLIACSLDERQGGVTTYVDALAAHLPAAGVEVAGVVRRGGAAGSASAAACGGYDVVLDAGPHEYRFVPAPGVPSVAVVHDIIPETLWKSGSVRRERARALAAADAAIAVSESTRRGVLREYGAGAAEIAVVHHGVSPGFFRVPPPSSGSPFRSGRYLLYVGKRGGYKRFLWFLRAAAPLMWRHPRLGLLCTGEPFCRREWAWIAALGLLGRVKAQRLAPDAMAGAYANAAALVYPSVCEGFGLPVLEAMAAGCPVVACGSASIPEVAGGAAALFGPWDAPGMRRALAPFLAGGEAGLAARREAAARGRARAALFTWDECARKTASVLASVLESATRRA